MTDDEAVNLVQESISFFDQGVFPGNTLPFTIINGPPVDGHSNFNFCFDRENGSNYLLYRVGASEKVASHLQLKHLVKDKDCSRYELENPGPNYTLEMAIADIGGHEVRHRLQFEDQNLRRFSVVKARKIPALKFLTKWAAPTIPAAINTQCYDAFEFDAFVIECLIAHEHRRGRTDPANLFSVVKLTPSQCLECEPFKSRYGR